MMDGPMMNGVMMALGMMHRMMSLCHRKPGHGKKN